MKKNWNEENDKFINSTHLHSITCGSNLQQEMTNYIYVQVTCLCISYVISIIFSDEVFIENKIGKLCTE